MADGYMFFCATNMSNELPKEILQQAVNLRNSLRKIFIILYTEKKPCTANEVAKLASHARAYVNMRLNQLEDMGLVKAHQQGKTKLFEIKETST